MKFLKILKILFSNFNKKFRISIRNPHTSVELWHIFISPLNVFIASVSLLVLLFVGVVCSIIYTPILDMLPGYPGNKSRELLLRNIIRLDSLEQEMNLWNTHRNNIALIMDGKTPVSLSVSKSVDSVGGEKKTILSRSAEDSLFRLKTQGQMNPITNKSTYIKALELNSPVLGIVSSRYNITEEIRGISVSVLGRKPVSSITEGVVVATTWNPEKGYVVLVQHGGNMVSYYENLSEVTKQVGQRVKSGEILGFVGFDQAADDTLGQETENTNTVFYFELWDNGYAVDPEKYILF